MAAFDDGIKATELGHSGTVETEVLLVDSGPAGPSMSLALSTYGIQNVNITKYRWTEMQVLADVKQLCRGRTPSLAGFVNVRARRALDTAPAQKPEVRSDK